MADKLRFTIGENNSRAWVGVTEARCSFCIYLSEARSIRLQLDEVIELMERQEKIDQCRREHHALKEGT